MSAFYNQFPRRPSKDNNYDYASSFGRRQYTPIWQPQFSSYGYRQQFFTTSQFTAPRVFNSVPSFSQTAPSQRIEFVKSVKHVGGYAYNFRTMEMNVGDDELRLLDTSKIKGLEGYDLSQGSESFGLDIKEEREESRRELPTGFRWLMEISDRNRLLTYDSEFACKRSLLVNIASEKCDRVLCVKFGRTIFMCDFSSKPRYYFNHEQRLLVYTGKKFEKVLTKPQPWIQVDDQPAGNGDAYYAIFRVVLGSTTTFKVLISAEVDGIDDNNDFIEIKTCQQPTDGREVKNKVNWWLQSYLVGVDRLFVGIKGKTIVRKIIELKNSDFQQNKKTDAYLNQLENFLKGVRSLMQRTRTPDDNWLLMERPRTQKEWQYRWLHSAYDRAPYREFVPDDFYTYFGIRRYI
ncbi:hypothetical protein M3Y94_00024500 [Aphelenchoides besseyi]|nr:hypothetical protein M3Y94_00024500 [Aphelenchoides besseyi]